MKGEYSHIVHSFEPVYDENSRILILGSLPSVKSRENNFYYGNPHNRFWKVLSALFSSDALCSIEEKTRFLLKNKIALWDVIAECDIIGSSDASIKNIRTVDLNRILSFCDIKTIFANGAAACRLYKKHIEPKTLRPIIRLPSTSPANAAYNLKRLTDEWKIILPPD